MGLLSMVLEGLPQESRERVLIWLGSIYPIRVVELPEAPKLVELPEAPKLVEPPKVVAPPKPVTKPSPSASVGPELVVQAVVELEKPPEPKATYHQRRRKTERRKL